MDTITFEKTEYTWYGISILPKDKSVDIVLLFRELDKGNEFFKLITENNPHPSFYCFQQPDKTHVLKLDFSSKEHIDNYLSVSCNLTLKTYPPLELLKQNKIFKIIIGTEQVISGIVQTMATHLSFVPYAVQYSENPDKYELPLKRQN
jgi:hypothetical protein